MNTKRDLIERSIAPALGEYVDDYDLEGIADAVGVYHQFWGWILRPGITDVEFWEACAEHDLTALEYLEQ